MKSMCNTIITCRVQASDEVSRRRLHAKGKKGIISGRRRSVSEEVPKANREIAFVEPDIESPANIASVAESLRKRYPILSVLVNKAGIMKVDNVQDAVDHAFVPSIVATNLLGPIRMTSALIEHLKQQPAAWVTHVTSGTAFVPVAVTAAYSATRAAHHPFSFSQQYVVKDTIWVLELAPPYVQTELMSAEQVAGPRHAASGVH
jgi:uncharacterized oxidoreductase